MGAVARSPHCLGGHGPRRFGRSRLRPAAHLPGAQHTRLVHELRVQPHGDPHLPRGHRCADGLDSFAFGLLQQLGARGPGARWRAESLPPFPARVHCCRADLRGSTFFCWRPPERCVHREILDSSSSPPSGRPSPPRNRCPQWTHLTLGGSLPRPKQVSTVDTSLRPILPSGESHTPPKQVSTVVTAFAQPTEETRRSSHSKLLRGVGSWGPPESRCSP